jgi:hypothetical protein
MITSPKFTLLNFAAALILSPTAGAAITGYVDPFANTFTLVVDDDTPISTWIDGNYSTPYLTFSVWQSYVNQAAGNASASDLSFTTSSGSLTTGDVAYLDLLQRTYAGGTSSEISGITLAFENGSVIAWSGTIVAKFSDLSHVNSVSSANQYLAFGSAGAPLTLVLVPEPSTALLGLIGSLALLRRRRR